MQAAKTRVARGRLVVVQEQRLRLLTDDGRGLLLTLGRFARVTPDDLCRWEADGVRVRVEYTGEPNLLSGVARRVRPEE